MIMKNLLHSLFISMRSSLCSSLMMSILERNCFNSLPPLRNEWGECLLVAFELFEPHFELDADLVGLPVVNLGDGVDGAGLEGNEPELEDVGLVVVFDWKLAIVKPATYLVLGLDVVQLDGRQEEVLLELLDEIVVVAAVDHDTERTLA